MDPTNVVAWILLVCSISIGVLCIKRDDRPGLTLLQQLPTRGEEPIRLLEGIVPQYPVYGRCLLADDDGVKMSIIKHDHKSANEITAAIFETFLRGGGKRPETWATVVECLRVADLNYLADSVDKVFEDVPPIPQSEPHSIPQPINADSGNDDGLVKILAAFDQAQSGEKGEIVVFGRKIRFKAKWRVHSFNEPIVWDATAQDVETGVRVEVKHQDTDKYANQLAVQKLCKELKSRGILHDEL